MYCKDFLFLTPKQLPLCAVIEGSSQLACMTEIQLFGMETSSTSQDSPFASCNFKPVWFEEYKYSHEHTANNYYGNYTYWKENTPIRCSLEKQNVNCNNFNQRALIYALVSSYHVPYLPPLISPKVCLTAKSFCSNVPSIW